MADAVAEAALRQAKMVNMKYREYFSTRFTGVGKQDPEAHILLFKRLCTDLGYIDANGGVTDANLILLKTLFYKTLSEKALLWYDSCQATYNSLGDLSTGFLRHFSGSHGVPGDLSLFNGLSWSQGETALEFRNRLKVIGDRLNLPEAVVKHRFIHGLPENVRLQLMPFYDQTIQNLMDMAQNLLGLNISSLPAAVNCAEAKEEAPSLVKSMSELQLEVGSMRRELTNVKQCVDSYYNSDGYYLEDTEGYADGEPEGFEQYDSYYAGPTRSRSFRSRFGRGYSRGRGRWFRGQRGQPRSRGTSRGVAQGYPGESSNAVPNPGGHRSNDPKPSYSDARVCLFCKRRGHVWSTCWDLQSKLESEEKVFP
jgi:hypothetical protein